MTKIRVGIIGLGRSDNAFGPGAWAVTAHLPPLRDLPEYEIVAVANSTVESAQKSIEHHGLPAGTRAYGSPEDIARDPNVDLVVVSVQVNKHFSLAKPALENKKDVFVEWPLGASLEEAEELTRLAQANNVKTIVGLQARADPIILKLKEIISSGKIGKVVSSAVIATTALFPADVWMAGAEYYLDFKSGGNEYHILFAHFLDSFTYVLGDFVDVHGLLKTQFATSTVIDFSTGQVVHPAYPRTAPDQILVQGTLANGAVASIAYRKAPASADDRSVRWIISGTEGEIEVSRHPCFWQYGNAATSQEEKAGAAADGKEIGPGAAWILKMKIGKDGELQHVNLTDLDTSPASKIPQPSTNTARLYQSFARGDGLEATFESATKTHRLLDRIAKSAGW